MSSWKVSKEEIEIFQHPDADKLELGKVGTYQVVVQKGLYKNGDVVVFAPEKSVLKDRLEQEYKAYLVGVDKNRVKGIRLKGEFSSGIIIPQELLEEFNLSEYAIGEDISEVLGITKYEPPIPIHLQGDIEPINAEFIGKHDCEQIGVYLNELVPGERIIVTEKLHGSQCISYKGKGEKFVSSKGYLKEDRALKESDSNAYWRGIKNSEVFEKLEVNFSDDLAAQVFGELIPCQGGYTYGTTNPIVKVFDIRINNTSIPYDEVPVNLKELWTPVIYDGPFIDLAHLKELAKGNETVSGKQLHIREGVVVAPYIDRRAKDGTRLRLKVINPAYKETGEEIN